VEQAKVGKIPTVAVIHKAFEQRVGEAVAPATVYRLLHRHGWRKLVPRPHHPQADFMAQQEFKKTSTSGLRRC
jgi:hypothetical protein